MNLLPCVSQEITQLAQDTPLAASNTPMPPHPCRRVLQVSWHLFPSLPRHHCLPPAPPLQPGLQDGSYPLLYLEGYQPVPYQALPPQVCRYPIPCFWRGSVRPMMSGRNKIARLDTLLQVTRFYRGAFTKSWGTAPAFAPLRMDLGIMPIFARMLVQLFLSQGPAEKIFFLLIGREGTVMLMNPTRVKAR